MGDRSNVYLTVLAVHKDEAIQYFDDNAEIHSESDVLITWLFEEVSYGELDFLDKLSQNGIPFNSEWNEGDEYAYGCAYCRFNDKGVAVFNHIYKDDKSISLEVLVENRDSYPALLALIKKQTDYCFVLPWDNQESNSNLYRAKQLIMG